LFCWCAEASEPRRPEQKWEEFVAAAEGEDPRDHCARIASFCNKKKTENKKKKKKEKKRENTSLTPSVYLVLRMWQGAFLQLSQLHVLFPNRSPE
jgi:hypothetical protein